MRSFHRELLSHLPDGYRVEQTARHHRIYDAEGNLVRQPGGLPVVVPTTPGDNRALKNTLSALRRSGVRVR